MAKLLFIHKLWYESLAIEQLSAVINKDGHQAYLYLDNNNPNSMIRFVENINPDIIGFSLMTGQHLWALEAAGILKKKIKNKPVIIFGGVHPTFSPEIIEYEPVDIVCRGEGEGALVDLLNCLDNRKDFSNIPNLWVKRGGQVIKNNLRPLVEDLDSLPVPDRSIFYRYNYFRNNPNKMVMTSRGCPFNCSFCFNEKYRQLYNIKTRGVRRRSWQNVIEELVSLKETYKKTRIIRFQDDIFTLDKQWLFDLLKSYKKEINLPFMCHIRAGMDDEETIARLSMSGCICVTFGIETGSEALRVKLLNKKITDQQFYDTAGLLKKYKIKFYTNNILFIPGSNTADIWETIKINQWLKPDYIVFNIFQPYPGTLLNEFLLKNNLITSDYMDRIKDIYSASVSESENINLEKNIYYFSYLLVKFPWLVPFIRELVKFKPNILFCLLFKIFAGLDYWRRNRLSFMRFLTEAYRNYDFK